MVECLVSTRMAWDCGVADLAAGCCSGGRMPNAGARRALRSIAGAPCRVKLSLYPQNRPSSRIHDLRKWLENWPEPKNKAEPGRDRTRGRRRGAPGADETERERERWCSWTCSSTTAADDVCTRRTTASSEFEARKTTSRERKRERLRG